MKGGEVILRTLASCGITVCFANPGTTEMGFVEAFDSVGLRPILCLFEGVATGAADGYGRVTGRPCATLLHLGPGFANGIANLHNARRASSPVVNIVGDHASFHPEAPLSSDIGTLARVVSDWVGSCVDVATASTQAVGAFAAACKPPGGIATLIVPADVTWKEIEFKCPATPFVPMQESKRVEEVVELLGERCGFLLRGRALGAEGLRAAGRVAAATGARLFCDTLTPTIRRGAGIQPVERIPYFPEDALEILGFLQNLVLVGARVPVSFFAYPNTPSRLIPAGCRVVTLATPQEDGVRALESLAERLGAPERGEVAEKKNVSLPRGGALSAETVGQAIAACLPTDAIISDEAGSSGSAVERWTAGCAPHDWLSLTGGSIGQGLPVAVGAAVGCPERKVVCLQADGGGFYTLQSLWTQAREALDITTVIFANRAYGILQTEWSRAGFPAPGPQAQSLFDLSRPEVNWSDLARALGIPATRATTTDAFCAAFSKAMSQKGPQLIEVVLKTKFP